MHTIELKDAFLHLFDAVHQSDKNLEKDADDALGGHGRDTSTGLLDHITDTVKDAPDEGGKFDPGFFIDETDKASSHTPKMQPFADTVKDAWKAVSKVLHLLAQVSPLRFVLHSIAWMIDSVLRRGFGMVFPGDAGNGKWKKVADVISLMGYYSPI